MNSGVRIIKRGKNNGLKSSVDHDEKTGGQNDREIVSTVKSWIAELELRKLSQRTGALRSLK